MSNFNSLPNEASPVLSDRVFTARGSGTGAERKATLQSILQLLTDISGNAGTATALQTARAINGVSFNGTADITVPSAAGTLTGATLAPGVTASSLLSAAGGAFGSAAFTASSAYQPINASNLTPIAALTTTSYGRSVLELANAAAARTLFGAGTGNGDVIGPATSADDAIPIFNGTNNKTIEASGWKITNSGAKLQSPILGNPSGNVVLQGWGGIQTSGGTAGSGLAQVEFGFTRDISATGGKNTDNWGVIYNNSGVSGTPRYGISFETAFDTSVSAAGDVTGEVYIEHRIDNGAGGAAAGSVVGGRLLQWNVTLPDSFANNPTAAAAYNTANGKFPGYVGLIGVVNSFAIAAYNSAGAARAAWSWTTSAASAGISIVSNTGYTFQRFNEWGGRTNNDENSIVGDATASFNLRNTATTFAAGSGSQFTVGASQHLEITNFENAWLKLRTNGDSFNPLIELSPLQRVFIGWNATGIVDSGATLQVKGNGLFTSTGDTLLQVTGTTYPGLKIVGTGFPSGVDIACESTSDFRIRINDDKPFLLMTSGTSRMNIHTTNSSYAPFNVGPSATPGTSMARVKHGVATLVGGTVTVSETTVTANSRIFLTSQADGGTLGALRVSARTASTSFVITSLSAVDTSTVAWFLVEP